MTSLQIDQSGQPNAERAAVKRRRSHNRKRALRKPDVIYYPTPDETVTEMLRLADIKQSDVLSIWAAAMDGFL
ncbi:MAG: hypothetical protein H0T77_01070 [Pyrinomonadaceae bacterium]|nr:hypothetical protein [Pyrinomonadaceae bacterium]